MIATNITSFKQAILDNCKAVSNKTYISDTIETHKKYGLISLEEYNSLRKELLNV